MEDMKQEDVQKLIGSFYKKNYHSGKVFTLKHFLAIGVLKSTIHRTIQRYEEGIDEKRKIAPCKAETLGRICSYERRSYCAKIDIKI